MAASASFEGLVTFTKTVALEVCGVTAVPWWVEAVINSSFLRSALTFAFICRIVLKRSVITAHVWLNSAVLLVSADTFWIGGLESRRVTAVLSTRFQWRALLAALTFMVIQPFFLEAAVHRVSTTDLVKALAFVSSLEGPEITAWILCKGVLADALRIRAVRLQTAATHREFLLTLALKSSLVVIEVAANSFIKLLTALTFDLMIKLVVLTARLSELITALASRMGIIRRDLTAIVTVPFITLAFTFRVIRIDLAANKHIEWLSNTSTDRLIGKLLEVATHFSSEGVLANALSLVLVLIKTTAIFHGKVCLALAFIR